MPLQGLNKGMFRAGDRVCCGVSGGADSVALLLGLLEANAGKQPVGVVLCAVHVHHGLRGQEADGDEAFVRALCDGVGVPLEVVRVDTAARRRLEGEGLEEAARELRYEVFRRLLTERRAEVLATAHTLDDQAETVMMKLLRGAWTEGLGAISPVLEGAAETPGLRSWAPGDGISLPATGSGDLPPGGRIVRPLLEVRRAEVEAYLRGRGQSWREDSTNGDLRFMRNRVRHELMPLLRSFNPAIDETLGRTSAIARDEEGFWRAELARVLPAVLLPGRPVRGGGRAVSTTVGERALALEIERLRDLVPALRRRVVRAAAAQLGCRIGSEETGRLLGLAGLLTVAGITPRIGGRLELAGGLRAERSARELRLSRTQTQAEGMLLKM